MGKYSSHYNTDMINKVMEEQIHDHGHHLVDYVDILSRHEGKSICLSCAHMKEEIFEVCF